MRPQQRVQRNLSAQLTAEIAQSEAESGITLANAAQLTANTALALGYTLQSSTLQRANNLLDLLSPSTARQNLGVDGAPIWIHYDGTIASGLTRYVPLTHAYTVPGNFNGTMTWCGTYPTADAVFTFSYIRGSFTTPIGTITFIHGGNYNSFSTFTDVSLNEGDILVIVAPNPADSTLANVGITLALELT